MVFVDKLVDTMLGSRMRWGLLWPILGLVCSAHVVSSASLVVDCADITFAPETTELCFVARLHMNHRTFTEIHIIFGGRLSQP